MQLFFVEDLSTEIRIEGEEAKHLYKVLRKKEGDIIQVTNGNGLGVNAEIFEIGKDFVLAEPKDNIQNKLELPFQVHIAISPTKNADRLEWMLEKSTELGITEITPIICERSERKQVNIDRLKKIALSAMKQSGRFVLPKINDAIKLTQIQFKEETRFVAHCMEGDKKDISKCTLNSNTIIFIGPEGDFSEKEIDFLIKEKCLPVSLGNSRLRTETAGVYAISAMRLLM